MSTLYIGGDKFICLGTVKEIAEYMGIKERTIWFYMSPAYKRRVEKRKGKKEYSDSIIVIKIEEDTNE